MPINHTRYGAHQVHGQAQPLIDIAASPQASRLSTSGSYAVQAICELLASAVACHGRRPQGLIQEKRLAYKARAAKKIVITSTWKFFHTWV